MVSRGYGLLPRYIRLIITCSLNEDMARALYAKAKEYLYCHLLWGQFFILHILLICMGDEKGTSSGCFIIFKRRVT